MLYTEEQILEVANTKDRLLYKRLYDAYYAALCRYASRLLQDTASEEDVVQEVFMRFWELETSFSEARAVTTYLYRAVYNACMNVLRDRKEYSGTMMPYEQTYADFDSDVNERLLIEEEYFRQIYLAIDSLALQRRQIILKTLEGKKIEEIAREMNISINTVKTLKRKAYNDLREMLPAPMFCFLLLFL